MFGKRRSAGPADMDGAAVAELVACARQAFVTWTTADGATVCATVTPIFVNGHIYMVSYKKRAKTLRYLKDSRCVVAMTNGSGHVILRGQAIVTQDPELMFMWAKAVGERAMPLDPKSQRSYLRHTVSPDRWPIKFLAEDYLAIDEDKWLDEEAG